MRYYDLLNFLRAMRGKYDFWATDSVLQCQERPSNPGRIKRVKKKTEALMSLNPHTGW
jgi:hypothetical protein